MVRKRNPERKEKFMASALTLFSKKGVNNTSTADIAKQAGAASGTLFLYFATKQELLDELVVSISKAQSAHINSLIEPSFTARESFWAIWHGTISWFLDNLEAYQYVQQVRDSAMISESAVEVTNRQFGYYYEAIQKGFLEGSIKPYPLGLIGDVLYQQIVAVINHLSRQSDPGQRQITIRQGFDIFWDGIKASAHEPQA
jgi:AcrR family transcriptional regulator